MTLRAEGHGERSLKLWIKFQNPGFEAMISYLIYHSLYDQYQLYYNCNVKFKGPGISDQFLHIGAVTVVNNRNNTLHCAIEEGIKFRILLMNSAVGC